MLAGELINQSIVPLKLSDPVQKALDTMAEFRLNQLPIVSNGHFIGTILQEDLLNLVDRAQLLKEVKLPLQSSAIQEDQHIYDVLRLQQINGFTVVPVLNLEKKYLGVIDTDSLLNGLSKITGALQEGSIIVLEISNRDNSLAHLAHLVEAEHAEILSFHVRSFPDSTRMELTIKLNRNEIGSIISAFLRYDYTILGVFNDAREPDDHYDRYGQLMNYLSI